MIEVIYSTILISSVLWIVSIILASKWVRFSRILVGHVPFILVYLYIINFTNLFFIGQNVYGLKILLASLFGVVIHINLGFAASIYLRVKSTANDPKFGGYYLRK